MVYQPQVVVLAARRTPIGSFMGQFSHLRAPDLAAKIISDIFRHNQFKQLIQQPGIDECVLGCVLSAGIGQAPARQALLSAQLPESIPCSTINKVCGSGMKAITMAFDNIVSGQAKLALAGGMESMSQAPYLLERQNNVKAGHRQFLDHLFFDGLENYFDGQLMGHFAELMVDKDPDKYGREQQDEFAINSLNKARIARESGKFENEVVCLDGVCADQQVIKGHVEKVSQLKPVFHTNGTITAANASSISDGAAMLLLADKQITEDFQLPALAYIRAYSQHAMSPDLYPLAPIDAVKNLLSKLDWPIDSVDLFEINEAFAVTAMVCIDELGVAPEKVNIHGGACALGHPIGASGCRVVVTLIHALRQTGGKRGLATVCIGGGEAMAVALELI